MQPLACFFGRGKTSDEAFQATARLSFLSKRSTAPGRKLLACFFGRQKTSDRPGANHGHARLSFLSKQVPQGPGQLACFFGRGKTSEAGQYRRGWLAKRSARLSFLSKRTKACCFAKSQVGNKKIPRHF